MAEQDAPPTGAGTFRVALAQVASRLGEVDENAERHLERIEEARSHGADLLVFPELSLTGYRLLHLTPRVAIDPLSSPLLGNLARTAGKMAVIVGLVERGSHGALHNSAALLADGAVTDVQRKLYLPSYGLFQEGRFFVAGSRPRAVTVGGHTLGILICEDLWHPGPARHLALCGAEILVVISSGPGHLGRDPHPATQESWELLTRAAALQNTCWVTYTNRVGWEEGVFFPGGSHVVAPGGRIVARSPLLEEHLLIVDLDLGEVGRLRRRLSLLADSRPDLEDLPEGGGEEGER